MEEENRPLLDQQSLDSEFGGYQPQSPPPSPQNVPFTGLPQQALLGNSPERLTAAQMMDLKVRKTLAKYQDSPSIPVIEPQSKANFNRYPYYLPATDLEDAYGQGQSWTDKMVNGVMKGVVLAGTTFLQTTVGAFNGLEQWSKTGNFSSFYDNEFNRSLDNLNKYLEDRLPNYYTNAERDAAWYSRDKIFTANFLWDGVVKNLGFAAGAALSGYATTGAINFALKSIPKAARLFSMGKQAELIAAIETQGLAEASAAAKFSKIKALSDRYLSTYNQLSLGNKLMVSGIATTGEAGIEAMHLANEYRESEYNKFVLENGRRPNAQEVDEIDRTAMRMANAAFVLNMGLLGVSNFVQFPMILRSTYKGEKAALNGAIREVGEIAREGAEYSVKQSKNAFVRNLKTIAPYTFSIPEALEEGGQYAISKGSEDFFSKVSDEENADIFDSILYGLKETFGTDEGMQNFLIGGLSGAIMTGVGRYRGDSQKAQDTRDAVDKFNQYQLSDFTKETYNSIDRGVLIQQNREQAIEDGKVQEAKDLEADYVLNYLIPRVKYGRLDLVKDDIAEYRTLASSEAGFNQLVEKGIALPGDTQQAFLNRLSHLESMTETVNSLYQSLNLRYAGMRGPDGKPLYSPESIDRLVYIGSKIEDYDGRIVDMKGELNALGFDIDPFVKEASNVDASTAEEFAEKAYDFFGKTIMPLDLREDQKEDIGFKLADLFKVAKLRKGFMDEYSEILQNPQKYDTSTPISTDEEDELGEEIKVIDKGGKERTLKKGQQYYLAGPVKFFNDGSERKVYPKFTVLGVNSDGTIRVKTKSGERNIDPKDLAQYKIGSMEDADKRPNARFFLRHHDEQIGKRLKGGKVQLGTLEYDSDPEVDKLYFVYDDKKGVRRREMIGLDMFKPKGKFKTGIMFTNGPLKLLDQKDIKENEPNEGADIEARRRKRVGIIKKIYDEVFNLLVKNDEYIERRKKELANIEKEVEELQEKISQEEGDKRSSTFKFKPTTRKMIALLNRKLKMSEQIYSEIENLQAASENFQSELMYLEDFMQNIDELPQDPLLLIDDLNEQVKFLEDTQKNIAKRITYLSGMIDKLEKAIKSAIDFISGLIQNFTTRNPDFPLSNTASEFMEFSNNLKTRIYNEEIEKAKEKISKMKPWAKRPGEIASFERQSEEILEEARKEAERRHTAMVAQIRSEMSELEEMVALAEDEEIKPSEQKLEAYKREVQTLSKTLEDFSEELNVKRELRDRFERIMNDYIEREEESEKLIKTKRVLNEALGTHDKGPRLRITDPNEKYEPESKKSLPIIPNSTVQVVEDPRDHHERSDRFAFRFPTMENRATMRLVEVTEKTEKELLPGLTDHVKGKSDSKKSEIIVSVVVEENEDGSISLVDEFGNPIDKDAVRQEVKDKLLRGTEDPAEVTEEKIDKETNAELLNRAVYQLRPLSKLTWLDGESMFRAEDEGARPTVSASYEEWRQKVLGYESLDQAPLREFNVSFGFLDVAKDQAGNYDYDQRTGVVDAGLVSEEDLGNRQVVEVATTDVIEEGTTRYEDAEGRAFLSTGNGLVRLNNRRLTKKEGETIFKVIVQLAKYAADPKMGVKSLDATRLIKFLKSVVYWGTPTDINGEPKENAFNSIYFERDPDFGLILRMGKGGKAFPFTPSGLERNKESILTIMEHLHNDVKNYKLKYINEEHEEIVDIKENGDVVSVIWPNYQTYLLSSTEPDGKARRNPIPLSTIAKPLEEGKINRHGIYFYTSPYEDGVEVPEVTKVKPTKSGTKPTKLAPAPSQERGPEDTYLVGSENVFYAKDGEKIYFTLTEPLDPTESKQESFEKIKLEGKKGDIAAWGENQKKKLSAKAKENPQIKELIKTEAGVKQLTKSVLLALILDDIHKKGQAIPQSEQESEPTLEIPTFEEVDAFEETPSTTEGEQDTSNLDNIFDQFGSDTETDVSEDDHDYRVVGEQFNETPEQTEKWNEVEAWFKKNLPMFPFYRVKEIIQSGGIEAWGMLKNSAIYVYENAEVGTSYHEAFEAVWKLFTSPSERNKLIREFRSRKGTFVDRPTGKTVAYKDATPQQIKEQLSEEFRDLVQFKKNPPKANTRVSFLRKLFNDIVNFIKKFFTGEESQDFTQQFFNKINEGGLANMTLPNNIGIGQVGIIDIDSASVEGDVEFRVRTSSIPGIPDKYRKQIIDQMTYLLTRKVSKTDQGLFEIPNLKFSEEYEELLANMNERFRRTAEIMRRKAKAGKISAKVAEKEMMKLLGIRNAMNVNWHLVVRNHKESLLAYNISFDENDNMQMHDEDRIKESDFADARKVDIFKKANGAIKMLLSTLIEVDENGQPILSDIGGVKLVPVSKTFITILNNVYDAKNPNDMLRKLADLARRDKTFERLFTRLTGSKNFRNINLDNIRSKHHLQLLNSFWTTFKKANPNVRILNVLPTGEVVFGEAYLSSIANQIKNSFTSSIVARAKSREDSKYVRTYLRLDVKRRVFVGTPLSVKNVITSDPKTAIKFLNNLGVDFDLDTYNQLDATDKKKFKDSVSGIVQSIRKAKDIVTLSNTALDINKRLTVLAYLKGKVVTGDFSSTFYGANREKKQSYIGVNPITLFHDFIKSIPAFTNRYLHNTRYRYLKTDAFSQNSVVLAAMFDGKGNRIESEENEGLLEVGYIDGLIDNTRGRNKASDKFLYPERLVTEINANLAGWYLNLVPGDASIEWMVKMGNHVSLESTARNDQKFNNIFRRYFLSELEVARENRTIPDVKGRKSSDLRFFKDILGEETHNQIVKTVLEGKLSNEEIYDKFKGDINKALSSFVEMNTDSMRKTLERYGILKTEERGMYFEKIAIEGILSEKDVNTHLKNLTQNYMIANIEMHKIYYSDPYQYKDELKRIKSFSSPRQQLMYGSKEIDDAMHRLYNDGYEKGDIGFTAFDRDYFTTASMKDVLGKGKLPNYEGYEESDGSGIISFRGYRNFRIRIGQWSDLEESQYRYDVAFEKQDKDLLLSPQEEELLAKGNPHVQSAYTPIKPIVAGNKFEQDGQPRNTNDVILDKFSLYPISYRTAKEINADSNLLRLHEKMREEDIDYVVFDSGRKVGSENSIDTYGGDGKLNTTPFYQVNVPLDVISLQTEVPSKDDNKVSRGTQMTKLVTMDLMEMGVPVDFEYDTKDEAERLQAWLNMTQEEKLESSTLYREIANNNRLLTVLTEIGYERLLKRLGIVETSNGYEIEKGDRSVIVQTLREEMLKRELNDNISDALDAFEDEINALEATPAFGQIRNILYSIVDKEVVSPKLTGGMKVQIPSTLMESERINKETVGKKTFYTNDFLKFYTNNDGERVAEIMIGRWFKSSKTDEELIEYFNTEEGKKVLRTITGVAYRIPTQKQNSIDRFIIKKFLPREMGDSVVIPSELVKKAGSDFDIDKLSMYLKNVKVVNGYPVAYEFLDDTNSTLEQRYVDWVEDFIEGESKTYFRAITKDKLDEIKKRYKRGVVDAAKVRNEAKKESVKSLYTDYSKNVGDVRTKLFEEIQEEVDAAMSQGSELFFSLPEGVRKRFFELKTDLLLRQIEGPQEFNYYRTLALGIAERTSNPNTKATLEKMIENYSYLLEIFGERQEQLDKYKENFLKDFREKKELSFETIHQSYLKSLDEVKLTKKQEYDEVRLKAAQEIASLEGLPTMEEFGNRDMYYQNTRKAIQNTYVESLEKLISSKENFEALTKPNSADDLKGLANDVVKATKGAPFDYTKTSTMLDRMSMSSLRHAFLTGKYAIGIAAVNQTNHALNQRQVIYLDQRALQFVSDEDRFYLTGGTMNPNEMRIKFKNVNTIDIGGEVVQTMSKRMDAKGKHLISDILSQFIDGYVDISKGPWIIDMNAYPNVASTFMLLTKFGVPIADVVYFMNQPIIRDYLDKIESAGYTWLYIQDFADAVMEEYSNGDTSFNRSREIPATSTLKTMMGKTVDKMSVQEMEAQRFMLVEFLKYSRLASQLFTVTQGTNFDTANFNDQYLVFKKNKLYEKAQLTVISSAEDIYENSHIKPIAENLNKSRDAIATVFKSDTGRVRQVIETALEPFIELSDKDFIGVAHKVVADFFDWVVQTDSKAKINRYIKQILVTNGGTATEVMRFINDVRRDPDHPLHSNYIIEIIEPLISTSAQEGGVNAVKVRGLDNKVYDQNNIIYGFRELKSYLRGTGSKLYDQLKLLAVLQSGLTQSTISFTSVLPYEDFASIYAPIINTMDAKANLDLFNDLGVIYRNNWNNDTFVAYERARWIQGKWYNAGMKFLPSNVKSRFNTEDKGKNVSTVVTMPANQRRNSDYITFYWEDKIPALQKHAMRKKGDYSFMHKGLFKLVREKESPYIYETANKSGEMRQYNVFRAVNAWGDGQFANEFYLDQNQSVLENGMIKLNEFSDSSVIAEFNRAMVEKSRSRVNKPGNKPAIPRGPKKC